MSDTLSTRILTRNFSDPLTFPSVVFEPQSYSFSAIGGPAEATITAYGPDMALWELIEWLRAPVEILDWRQEAVWWGFIEEVTVRVGAIEVGCSLSTMSNRLALTYSLVAPGSTTVGTRATTSWVQDDDSVALFGIKEQIASLSGATATVAENARDTILAMYKYPIPILKSSPGNAGLSATLRCSGWWKTLGWQYYANTDTDDTETTTQIEDIVTSEGQFITGVDIVDASGITSSEYRDGDGTALKEIEELLEAGTTSGRRLLATITQAREVRVYEEPEMTDSNIEIYVQADGKPVNRWGNKLVLPACPVAIWCGLKDVIPATLDVSRMADPTKFFVEEASFNVQNMAWTPTPRGVPSVWAIGKMAAG